MRAAHILARQGFADVHIVRSGTVGWNDNRFPFEGRDISGDAA
ncbi:MAG: hypothetical protein QNI91_11645 [Arenicellales bacterium]|nr:hypothetical protein [Arenicellales bacterium]